MFWIPNFTEDVKNLVWWLWDAIQQLLATPSTFISTPAAEYFMGNSAGLATRFVFYVFVITLVAALFIRRKRKDGAISFLNMVLSVALIPLWVGAAEAFVRFGDTLKRFTASMGQLPEADQASNDLLNVQMPFIPVEQMFVTLFFAICLAAVGFQLLFLMIAYELANVVIISLSVIVFAISGLGENTRKFFSLLVSFFVVTGILGIPIILFVTQLAQLVSDGMLGDNNPTGSIILLTVGAFIGLALQPMIIIYTYKRVDRVMGNVIAKINDKVRSVTENKQRFDAHLAGSQKSTMSFRFRESMANMTNAGIDKFDNWRSGKAALATKRIADAADRYKSAGKTVPGGKAEAAANAVGLVGAGVSKVVPHPAAKVAVAVGSTTLNALIRKVGSASIPRVNARRE